jgi:anhydro-N-acetylmuramic acid kinase
MFFREIKSHNLFLYETKVIFCFIKTVLIENFYNFVKDWMNFMQMKELQEYKVIGMMSGTSLDGLDIAYCVFRKEAQWVFEIGPATTIAYDARWKESLSTLEKKSAFEFVKTHSEYGHYLGQQVQRFIASHQLKPDFVASHGHTIFHQPHQKITTQIGDGAAIAGICGLPVVCDFRSLDVALGGQGAPLVPLGDAFLFPNAAACLNLGGIANISFQVSGLRMAFDICPVNMVLNYLAATLNLDFDDEGKAAASGKVNISLLQALNNLHFYMKPAPKSLGKEWVYEQFIPLLAATNCSTADKLATVTEHIALQIKSAIPGLPDNASMLITGGGAFNTYLVKRIEALSGINCLVPESKIINYKEALIFAFLGMLRMLNEVNCLKSVTGAERDNIGGAIYLG